MAPSTLSDAEATAMELTSFMLMEKAGKMIDAYRDAHGTSPPPQEAIELHAVLMRGMELPQENTLSRQAWHAELRVKLWAYVVVIAPSHPLVTFLTRGGGEGEQKDAAVAAKELDGQEKCETTGEKVVDK